MSLQMNAMKDNDTFINDLVNTFPEIREEVLDEDYSGLITLQIGCFRRYTQNAIDANDLDTVKKCFRFVESNIGAVENKIENALYISYLSHLNILNNSKIKSLLPPNLKSAFIAINDYNESASKNDKLNSFLKNLK
jgi:hypothetical protein